jgi:hypothetical protein
LQIDLRVKDYNLSTGPTTNDTDAADTNVNAKTIPKLSEQEHILYLLRGIPSNDEWKVFLELMLNKNTMMTTTPDEIVTKLIEKEAAIKKQNGLTPEALLFAKNGGKGGASAKKYSVWAEWLRQRGRAPSEPSETPRWQITRRPASRQRVAVYIALRSSFHYLFALCRSPILNHHSGVVANCDNTSEWVHWVRACIGIAMRWVTL